MGGGVLQVQEAQLPKGHSGPFLFNCLTQQEPQVFSSRKPKAGAVPGARGKAGRQIPGLRAGYCPEQLHNLGQIASPSVY